MRDIHINEAILILGKDLIAISLAEHLNRENYYNVIIIDEKPSSEKEIISNDIPNMTSYMVGNIINLDKNIFTITEKNSRIITIKASSIVVINKKYLKLFSLDISNLKNIKLNHMFQTSKSTNNIFISPTILLGELSRDMKIKIGRLMGKQINLKLIEMETEADIDIVCEDPQFSYLPHMSPSKGKIPLIYKSVRELRNIKINNRIYEIGKRKSGILIVELKEVLQKDRKEIWIKPNP